MAGAGRTKRAWIWRRSSAVARSLHDRGVIGRFSTFLEHVKPTAGDKRVTRYNALFHWAVPPGREIEAGREVGRFHIMTHAYWREGGPEFQERQHHGRRARPGQIRAAGPQSRHRRALGEQSASRSATPMSSGAAAAKSNRRKSRPTPTAHSAAASAWTTQPRNNSLSGKKPVNLLQ